MRLDEMEAYTSRVTPSGNHFRRPRSSHYGQGCNDHVPLSRGLFSVRHSRDSIAKCLFHPMITRRLEGDPQK